MKLSIGPLSAIPKVLGVILVSAIALAEIERPGKDKNLSGESRCL